MVRAMTHRDGARVLEIYRMGIETGNATFETAVPSWADWDRGHLPHSRLVFERGGSVLGWAALSAVFAREAYRGVAEVSVYVDTGHLHQGVGTRLLEQLIESSESNGIWTLAASVFPENAATVRLHEKCGFNIAGTRERIGRLNGRWRDTLLLERRSSRVGV